MAVWGEGGVSFTVHHGDALAILPTLAADSIDAIVTDPPAGIGFMGKTWDKPHGLDATIWREQERAQRLGKSKRRAPTPRELFVAGLSSVLRECYRVAKPGARMFCWAIPRTCGWTQQAIEDAGWLVENCAVHLFGSGFPKGKGQLKPAAEFWFLARKPGGKVPALNIDECRVGTGGQWKWDGPRQMGYRGGEDSGAGYGASTVGRWPPNVLLSHADGCVQRGTRRVKATSETRPEGIVRRGGAHAEAGGHQSPGRVQPMNGYADPDGLETVAAWECVKGCPVKVLDEQSGITPGRWAHGESNIGSAGYAGGFKGQRKDPDYYKDTGTASRFFPQFPADEPPFLYAPKASRRERNAGCEGLPEQEPHWRENGLVEDRTWIDRKDGKGRVPVNARLRPRANHHPTVKPQALMRWLCRLIAKPGGTVLDPFAGSGSTGVACIAEGMYFIGVEREAEYVEIARARLEAAATTPAPAPRQPPRARKPAAPPAAVATPTPRRGAEQMSLFAVGAPA